MQQELGIKLMTETYLEMDADDVFQAPQKPGQLLHEARVAKGLDIEQVTAMTRLSKQCVVDIERDVYSDFPAVIYLRGYLRVYAKAMDIPEADVISAFEAHFEPSPSRGLHRAFPREQPTFRLHRMLPFAKKSKKMQRKRIWLIAVVISLVLLATVGLWWKNRDHHYFSIDGKNSVAKNSSKSSEPLLDENAIIPQTRLHDALRARFKQVTASKESRH